MSSRFSKIRETLWPKGPRPNVWAILDCAAHPGLFSAMLESHNRCGTLYAGDLTPALERVSPHLVQLELDDSRFTGRLFDHAWTSHWGIAFRSDAGFETLRKHFRRFLTVRDYTGKKLVFRYYDPRILRAYLPTCVGSELETVYGPVESYYLDAADPAELLYFGREQGKLMTRTIEVLPKAMPA